MPAGQGAACVEISTLGGPVLVGSEATLAGIKAGKPRLGIRTIAGGHRAVIARVAGRWSS